MAVADLRKAFNAVSEPRYTCVQAYLGYRRTEGNEFQILTFSGTGADGNAFSVESEPIPANGDVMAAARATAQATLDKQEPLT